MSNKHLYFIGMLISLIGLTNCDTSTQTETSEEPITVAEALNLKIDCDITLPKGCKDFHESTDSLKVKPKCAKAFINYWQCFADALNKQLDAPYKDMLKYGFQIPKGELEQIIEDDQDGLIWAMMTIIPDGNGKIRPDLFFQGEKKPKAEKANGDDEDFFDFTKPCPTNCPDN